MLLANILCWFGIHEPMKYTEVIFYGKRFQKCRRCGKLLDTIEVVTYTYDEKRVTIRDNGKGINLERLIEYIHYSHNKDRNNHTTMYHFPLQEILPSRF